MVTCWLLVLSWGGVEMSWSAPPILGLSSLGLLLIVLLAIQERRSPDPLMPPRLFANTVFVRGVAIAFCAAMAMFGCSFLLPLFFQLVRGDNAAIAGALVAPFLGATCIGATISGLLARRHGRMKAILIAGVICCGSGFLMLSMVTDTTPTAVLICIQLFLGIGLGMIMPGTMICVQNAAERRDLGAATGCMLFLRSMGGAFGSTLVGALLASGFAQHLAVAGIVAHLDLGDVRQHGSAIAGLDPAMLPQVLIALVAAFHMGFLACAAAMGAALIAAIGMHDLPLRGNAPEQAGVELVH